MTAARKWKYTYDLIFKKIDTKLKIKQTKFKNLFTHQEIPLVQSWLNFKPPNQVKTQRTCVYVHRQPKDMVRNGHK